MKVESRRAPENLRTKIMDEANIAVNRSRTLGLAQQGQIPLHGCRLDLQHQRNLQFISGCRSFTGWLLLELQITFSVWGNTDDSYLTLCPRVSWHQADMVIPWGKSKAILIFFFFFPQKLGKSNQVRIQGYFLSLMKTDLISYWDKFWVLLGCIYHILGKGTGPRQDFRYCAHEGHSHSWGRGTQWPEGRRVRKVVFTFLLSYAYWPVVWLLRYPWRIHYIHVLLMELITAYISLLPLFRHLLPTSLQWSAGNSRSQLKRSHFSLIMLSNLMLVLRHCLRVEVSLHHVSSMNVTKVSQSLFKLCYSPLVLFDTHFSRWLYKIRSKDG